MSMRVLEQAGWLAPHWRALSAYLAKDRVPQALLIVGKEGVGKMVLAEAFSQKLLCRNPQEYACGECVSCRLFAAKTLPDFIRVEPEEQGKIIPVDAIRGLISQLALKPQYGGRRVVLLAPAHQMNIASANSLLKTLEEPDGHTSLLLLTDSPHLLPATIRSRCQRMDIPLPERSLALAWLKEKGQGERAEVLLSLARGAPLKALGLTGEGLIEKRGEFYVGWQAVLERRDEPTVLAEKWAKFPCETLAEWMISWTMDLIRLGSVPRCEALDNPDLAGRLQALAQAINLTSLFGYLDRLTAARRMLTGQANRQLLLEELLILGQALPRGNIKPR
jgi:DNA polymerase-3 subunit delta'